MRVLSLLLFLFVPLDQEKIEARHARTHAGKTVTVCGKVVSAKHAESLRGAPTFLNFERDFPNQSFTALVWGKDRAKFDPAPESLVDKRVCVRGLITIYKGKPQTVLRSPDQIVK